MNDITEPLRLAAGSHRAGTGAGCAMNVISWENGDTEITDFPACAHSMLARIVQRTNDFACTHGDGALLCSACSVEVLALAHRTVGTAAGLGDIAALGAIDAMHICAAYQWDDDRNSADRAEMFRLAHAAITQHLADIGAAEHTPDPEVTAAAVKAMQTVA